MSKTKNVTFCITGELSKRRVDVIQEIQNKTNAKFISGVSKNTDYLISARTDTVKAKNAKKFGTKVIHAGQQADPTTGATRIMNKSLLWFISQHRIILNSWARQSLKKLRDKYRPLADRVGPTMSM